MKRICILLVTIGLAALSANAQTVTGSGTTNTIPKFTGSSTIGDSQIRQVNDNIGINTDFIVGRLSVFESRETGVNFPQPYALYGNISSATGFAAGVRGDANTGAAIGVIGTTFALDGKDGGGGIEGLTSATTGFSFGARGEATGATGNTFGVFGIDNSPDGVAGVFVNEPAGNILLGGVGPAGSFKTVFRVDGRGTIFADGGFRPFGADFAESVAVKDGLENYAPGDLLVIDPSGQRRLSLSQSPYSTLVAGIYSTQPGVVASTHRVDEALPSNEIPLAVVGIVPCKVIAENGPIAPGDLLVTSSIAGHAMKGTDRSRMLGAVVGKALEPLQKGTGVIQVLVTLQ